jgi:hypothetical protein
VVGLYTKSISSTKSTSTDELSQPSISGSSWGFGADSGESFFYGIRGWGGPGGGEAGAGEQGTRGIRGIRNTEDF